MDCTDDTSGPKIIKDDLSIENGISVFEGVGLESLVDGLGSVCVARWLGAECVVRWLGAEGIVWISIPDHQTRRSQGDLTWLCQQFCVFSD